MSPKIGVETDQVFLKSVEPSGLSKRVFFPRWIPWQLEPVVAEARLLWPVATGGSSARASNAPVPGTGLGIPDSYTVTPWCASAACCDSSDLITVLLNFHLACALNQVNTQLLDYVAINRNQECKRESILLIPFLCNSLPPPAPIRSFFLHLFSFCRENYFTEVLWNYVSKVA